MLGTRRTDRLETVVAEIKAKGGEAIAVAMDVADKAPTIAALDAAEAAFGPVDSVSPMPEWARQGINVNSVLPGYILIEINSG